MEKFLEIVMNAERAANDFVWGPIMLALLVGTGVFLTFRTGWVQVRWFGYIMKNTVGSLFRKKDAQDHGSNLSPFQAVTTALAGTVGTGNIAGVTGAIFIGGPGAVFWMWVSAFFGMCTKYAEIALALKFRDTGADGVHKGGPMYYIENGLGKRWKWLAVIFAILGGLASFGIGNIAQSSEIAGAVSGLFGLDPMVTGIALTVLVGVVVLGGVKRIGQVTSLLVPFMAIFYILAGIFVIVLRIADIPAAFGAIFSSAFSLEAVGGGIFGYAIMLAMKNGFARGVFSNEAGLGSAPIAHAASNTKDPVEQGMWGVFEVFVDTIVICTLTGFVVVMAHLWSGEGGEAWMALDKLPKFLTSASALTPGTGIFDTIVIFLITVCFCLFAFTCVIGFFSFSEIAAGRITTKKSLTNGIRILGIFITLFCSIAGLDLGNMWAISDLGNILIVFANIPLLYLGCRYVFKATDHYKKKDGSPFTSKAAGITCEYWDERAKIN